MADYIVAKASGEGIFHLPDDAPCPRVGDVLHFSFTADNPETWAPNSWDANKKLSGTAWRVIRVEHRVIVRRRASTGEPK